MSRNANFPSNKMAWNIMAVHHLLKKKKDQDVQQKLINKAICRNGLAVTSSAWKIQVWKYFTFLWSPESRNCIMFPHKYKIHVKNKLQLQKGFFGNVTNNNLTCI